MTSKSTFKRVTVQKTGKMPEPTQGNIMENQHRKIKGYRELTETEIDLMNEIKLAGQKMGMLVEKLRSKDAPIAIDQRWVSIGATDLQTGLMALTRAVAQPDFF